MVVIKVPKTPKSAFNPDRPASSLIQAQIEHLEAAAGVKRRAAASARSRRAPIKEGDAAAYIARLTTQIQLGKPEAPSPGEAAAVTRRKPVKAKVTKVKKPRKPAARSKAASRKKAAARARRKGR
jgi:hypothetical protein